VRPLVLLLSLLAATAGCDSPASRPAREAEPLALPTIHDVMSSNHNDKGCICVLHGQCANIADAVPGRFEGRNLECEPVDRQARKVRCRFDERFVAEWPDTAPSPSPWQPRDSVYTNLGKGAWCLG
jgi:hypothetical protein